LVPGGLNDPELRKKHRLGIERTDWDGNGGTGMIRRGLRPIRSVLIDAESSPGEWTIGATPTAIPFEEIVEALPQRRKVS
jgi:hypothetical protein